MEEYASVENFSGYSFTVVIISFHVDDLLKTTILCDQLYDKTARI